MSRYTLKGKQEGQYAAVGFDRPLSEWFFQLYGPEPEPTEDDPHPDDSPIMWRDTRSNAVLVALIDEHCDTSDPSVRGVREAIFMDCDPDEYLGRNTTT